MQDQTISECFLTGYLKCQAKNIYKVDSNTSANENNKHRVSPTENEVNELILIANINPQKVKQFIRYEPYFVSFVGLLEITDGLF